MHMYVELWNTKPAWHALSKEERQTFLDQVGPGIQKLQDAGVEIVGFARDDGAAPHSAGYRYIAIWKMPNEAACRQLENQLVEADWHRYFDQVNARGEVVPPPQVLSEMAELDAMEAAGGRS